MDTFKKLLRRYKYIVNLFVLVLGIILLIIANSVKSEQNAENASSGTGITYDITIGIGCSVTATAAITLFLLALLPGDTDNEQATIIKDWGLCNIYGDRRDTALSGVGLPKNQLDYIAFGLKHFRDANSGPNSNLVKRLRKGLKVRIITLYPKSQYAAERQRLEKRDGLSDEIAELWKWKENMLKYAAPNCSGSIDIKYYNSLPLDFYCRADNKIFVGPYIPGKVSGANITYEFRAEDTMGGKYYAQLFDSLWDGNILDFIDYNVSYLRGNQKVAVENTLKFFCKQLIHPQHIKEPMGIVVMFKGENRRTFFSCNKLRRERNNCYQKNKGTVGRLIALSKTSETQVKILFEDFESEIAFVSQYTDAIETQKKERFEKRTSEEYDDSNVKAIMAISISIDDEVLGVITFDFTDFSQKYKDELKAIQAVEEGQSLPPGGSWELQRWFALAESCRDIIQPMLGNDMELQYKNLFEEEWKI